jgi:membrane protease YdiL (CAAX protease family)
MTWLLRPIRGGVELLSSILPDDRTQLIFLTGVVCILASSQLRWGLKIPFVIPLPINPLLFVILAPQVLLFAGAAGYFACFRPGSQLGRRLLLTVCLPAAIGLVAECGFYVYAQIRSSESQNGELSARAFASSFGILFKLGPGLHYALVGLALVGLFTAWVMRGSSSLPLALRQVDVFNADDTLSWSRFHILLWVLLVWVPVEWSARILVIVGLRIPTIAELLQHPSFSSSLSQLIPAAMFLLLAQLICGTRIWSDLRSSIRLPAPEMFLLAAVIPVAAVLLGSGGYFLLDRGLRLADISPESEPMPFTAYLDFPTIGFLCSFVVAAFCEEVIFRGFLQPRLVRRYGVLRGLVLVGLVWSAWHSADDFSRVVTDWGLVVQIALRLLVCVILGMFLGWLTFRAGSILPATLAHAIYNSFAELPVRSGSPLQAILTQCGWTLLVAMVFRYWPVHSETWPMQLSKNASARP